MKENIQEEKETDVSENTIESVDGKDSGKETEKEVLSTPPKNNVPKIRQTLSPDVKEVSTPSPKYQSINRRDSFNNNPMGISGLGVRRPSNSMAFESPPSRNDRDVNSQFEMHSVHLDVGSYNQAQHNAFSIPQSPNSKTRLFPPTTPKSRNNEVFLSPSSPKLKSPGVYKENGKPIREISNNLKTRLNYALVKLQNGWTEKTLSELEKELDGSKEKGHGDETLKVESQRRLSTYNNIYANDNSDDDMLVANGDHTAAKFSITKHKNANVDNKDLIKDTVSTSAHKAFLKAISSPKNTGFDRHDSPVSPLKWNKRTISPVRDGSQAPEEEAVETLMSLSSPKKSSPRLFETSKPIGSLPKEQQHHRGHLKSKSISDIKYISQEGSHNPAPSLTSYKTSRSGSNDDATDIDMEYEDVQTEIEDPESSIET